MPVRTLSQLLRSEFSTYDARTLRQDALAGLTVAAVALPLALAFGVASGATAAAGLVTAVVAGIVIGGLSGSPYQISGPTGAMSAVLIVLAHKYGLQGIWIAGLFSGLLLTAIGCMRLGRFIAFIPAPVITGFTSGIALIIIIGQVDALLGVQTPTRHTAAHKLLGYFQNGLRAPPCWSWESSRRARPASGARSGRSPSSRWPGATSPTPSRTRRGRRRRRRSTARR